jgi:hypothetical protein
MEERAGERRSLTRSYKFAAIFDDINKAKWHLFQIVEA